MVIEDVKRKEFLLFSPFCPIPLSLRFLPDE